MKRRDILYSLLATSLFVAVSLSAMAQTGSKVPRIGFLALGSGKVPSPQLEAFRKGLRDMGYVEGSNLALEIRWAEGQFDKLPELATDLLRWKPDLLVTVAPQGLQALRSASQSIPVVIVACDPAESIVKNIARPSGNITGVTCMAADLTPKRMQLLKEAVPRIRRMAVLYNPFDPNKADEVSQMHDAARMIGISLYPVEARDSAQIDEAFSRAVKEHADALFVLNDPFMFQARKRISELAAKHKLPGIYAFKEYVEAGGFMSYGTMQNDLFQRAAAHAGKVLRGTKPADLPVEQATHFELVINLKTAKALGIKVPQPLLLRADRMIE